MNDKVKIRKNWMYAIYIAILFMLALVLQDIVKESLVFNHNIDLFQEELNSRLKEDVFAEVDFRVREIESNIARVNQNLEAHVIEDLNPLVFSLDRLYEVLASSSQQEKRTALIQAVKAYDLKDEKHCFYVLDSTGVKLYDCETKSVVNVDVYQEIDFFNRKYMKTIVDETLANGTAQLDFYIERDDEVFKTVSHSYLDTETEYIIGIQVEYQDYNEFSKTSLIYEYNNYYDDDTELELLIIDGDSTILFHKNTDVVGMTVGEIETFDVYLSTSQIYSFYNSKSAGYLEYTDVENGNIIQKIAYVKYIEEWDMMIASSLETGSYDYLIDNLRTENYNNTVLIKVPVYIVLVILGFIIYRIIKKNIMLSISISDEEEKLYKRFANITTDSIVITDDTGIVQFVNKFGEKTLFNRFENDEEINLNNLLVEEDGYYTIFGEVQTYHVKYIVEHITYNSEQCYLYIIKDLTDKIITEKTLTAMTLADDLTKLGNRRLLVSDFQEKVVPFVKDGNASQLVMIDLDNFKEANDKYGHSFGDQVLLTIAGIFASKLEESSNIYRIGGDEFAILTKGETSDSLIGKLKSINKLIQDYDFGKEVNLSFSAGVVDIKVTDAKRRLSDYYEQADEKLYQAKENGKSTIIY